MNDARKQLLESLEAEDVKLFDKIKGNPKPDPLDLWALSSKRFVEWRKLNDLPVLLNHFDRTLTLFKEWKVAYKLTNEIIIATGEITPFLENKKLSKNKTLYLTKQTYDGVERTLVAYGKLEGKKEHGDTVFNYELLQEFMPYLDWLNTKKKTQQILYINSRSAMETPHEQVYIHANVYAGKTDFELLKMGGIDLPVNGFRILFRGKRLEFVNLCGLKLKGEVHFGEMGNLSCSYCACDNWEAENFSMPMLDFEHCTVNNFKLKNSTIQQWRFYDTEVSGDFTNSKLANVRIFGGSFRPIMQDCSLFEVEIEDDTPIGDNNYYAYKTLKKMYANQGDDDKAKDYFIKESEYIRKRLKGIKYITKSLSYYYWEYGRKPHRIIYYSLAIIFIFGFLYWLNRDSIAINSSSIKLFTIWDGFYFSTTTYTTLGYGDLSPLSGLRILTSIEAFLGVINMGFLIAGYSNNKY